MREIGSEFHRMQTTKGKGLFFPNDVIDYSFCFCGRTAIETVLKNEINIKKALLPSYCCDSMIQPFIKSGIEISFYGVNYYDEITIELNIENDIDCIVWCNYFGFDIDMPPLDEFIENGGIIIEDITHSFFSERQFNKQSHYLVASLRKWEPILCGGYCGSLKNKLKYKPTKFPSQVFLEQKKNAMEIKKAYLEGNTAVRKETFLKSFSEGNVWISNNYSNLKIDNESLSFLKSVNQELEKKIRRDNAKILYEGLKNAPIRFLFKRDNMDCPLFLPIIIDKAERDWLRRNLINNEIYCPVHWPKPQLCKSNLYDMELSLPCDHRYDEDDMKRIVSVVCS